MCIIMLALPETIVPDSHLLNSFSSNSDGCGFAYINTDYLGRRRLKIEKSMSFESFLKKYHRAVKNNPYSPFMIHFRYATHGTVDTFNCHPFKVNHNLAMVHNGIITGVGTDTKKSDTQLFNDKILKHLPKDFYKHEAYTLLLEKFLVGSKMVTLDINGDYKIYNESVGHWKDGVWYSNNSYVSFYQPVKINRSLAVVKAKPYTTTYDSAKDLYLCDGCNTFFDNWECNYYKTFDKGELLCYCRTCKGAALGSGKVTATMGISKYRYDIEVDQEDYYAGQRAGGYC